jgi:hypothetical protein
MKRLMSKCIWTLAMAAITRKYTAADVSNLIMEIGPMCEPQPAIHAFSGCDYTARFMWKTKVKMYKKS